MKPFKTELLLEIKSLSPWLGTGNTAKGWELNILAEPPGNNTGVAGIRCGMCCGRGLGKPCESRASIQQCCSWSTRTSACINGISESIARDLLVSLYVTALGWCSTVELVQLHFQILVSPVLWQWLLECHAACLRCYLFVKVPFDAPVSCHQRHTSLTHALQASHDFTIPKHPCPRSLPFQEERYHKHAPPPHLPNALKKVCVGVGYHVKDLKINGAEEGSKKVHDCPAWGACNEHRVKHREGSQ